MSRLEQSRGKPDDPWQVVLTRDRSWDGALFYGVRTTGIYCRPSCPSRRPKPENVAFFDSADSAERAGFRACHRCQPRSATGTTTERRIRRALRYLDEHPDERVTLDRLGRAVGLSPFHLQRAFKDAVGVSPREYQEARRLEVMKARLNEGDQVGRAVWAAGYGSVRGAYESAARGTGMTPGQYRSGAEGLHIRYALRSTRFGPLIVAWTSTGVCAVLLGDAPDALARDLEAEFPSASITAGEPSDTAWVDAVLAYVEGRHPGLAVPLDLHGSAFQLRVWKALREIPFGEVRTYRDIAQAIGAPGSARAVARACATNRTAVVVPCHRVVRSDGSLSGYRWGEDRKRRLLEQEQQLAGA
ncbi:MAG TPA: bifunctional DNA-binding transcriptional regulator/O6-methylguanine-DNA methyltransferase Ada [Longimicrobiales bacterium]